MKEIPSLTGMRGVAALYVMFYHFATLGYLIKIPFIQSIQQAGWSGVDFFFVLSGYLLYSIYPKITTSYFVRRVMRTFPLYYASLPLYAFGGLLVISPLYFVYAQNYFPSTFTNTPLWTLAIEEAFYFLLFPLILKLRPRATVLVLFAVALNLLSGIFLPQTNYATKQIPNYFIDYAIGICLATVKPRGTLAWKWAASLLVVVVIVYYQGNILAPLQATMFGIAYGAMLLAFQDSRVFANRVCYFLGRISYGLYVLQFPLMYLLGPIWGAAATLALSALSWRYFEARFVAFGRRFA